MKFNCEIVYYLHNNRFFVLKTYKINHPVRSTNPHIDYKAITANDIRLSPLHIVAVYKTFCTLFIGSYNGLFS